MSDFGDLGKSELQKSIEKKSAHKAVEMERETAKKTKKARLKLEKAANVQKGTTDRIRRHNESLLEAKKSGFKTYENAKSAKQKATELEKNQNAFNPFSGIQTTFSNWLGTNTEADQEIEKMKNRPEVQESIEETESTASIRFGKADFKEQQQTNDELARVLASVKEIKKETKAQKREGEKQATHLQDIRTTGEFAQKEAEEATNKLNEFNKNN